MASRSFIKWHCVRALLGVAVDEFILWRSDECIRCLKVGIISTLRPRQNGRYFPDDNFKCIFLNENVWISIAVSLKFVPRVQLTIFQHWFREWLGADQATTIIWTHDGLVWWRIYASLGLNELTHSPLGDVAAILKVWFWTHTRLDIFSISLRIFLMQMAEDFTDDKATLSQIKAWCWRASILNLAQCWPRSIAPHCVTRRQWVNT